MTKTSTMPFSCPVIRAFKFYNDNNTVQKPSIIEDFHRRSDMIWITSSKIFENFPKSRLAEYWIHSRAICGTPARTFCPDSVTKAGIEKLSNSFSTNKTSC